MKLINPVTYMNGNVKVTIDLATGTKIRETEDDEFRPDFAECCDVHISDRCNNGCEFCYAGCSEFGKEGDLMNWKFFDTLHPWTEMAINVQEPVHPDLVKFLQKMRSKHVIVNVTVNQNHFMKEYFRKLLLSFKIDKLIYGIGVSLVEPTDEFVKIVSETPDIVVHCINGIVTTSQLRKMAFKGIKILILGYKNLGRGITYIKDPEQQKTVRNRKECLYWNLKFILNDGWFDIISFDNLALEQLNPRRFLSKEKWNEIYMGDDGTSTFFINLVDGTFGINSLTTREERYSIENKSIDEMFNVIRKYENKGEVN